VSSARLDTEWAALALRTLNERSVAYIGINVDHARRVAALDGAVAATVEVTLESEEPSIPMQDVAALTLTAPTRSNGALQAALFAETVAEHADEVNAFLDQHDPNARSALVSPLALPVAALGKVRASWAPDAELARTLEEKRAGAAPVEAARWIPSSPLPATPTHEWWRAARERFGGQRLVVQSVGLNGGGERVWFCDSFEALAEASTLAGPARVSPHVDGASVNAMGCIAPDGAVLTLPPTRQLISDIDGRRMYSGNIASGLSREIRERAADDVRSIGGALIERGYVGPFGIDGIVDASGACHFHDFNARVNGAVHLFEAFVPAMAGLLTAPGWLTHANVRTVQDELATLVARHPLARWMLVHGVETAGQVSGPASGRYAWTKAGATRLSREDQPDAIERGTIVVRALSGGHRRAQPGDFVATAHVWMDGADADALVDEHGDAAMLVLSDVLAGARDAI
jgi:hypothetical protein